MDWFYFDRIIELYESGVLKGIIVQALIILSIAFIADFMQRKVIKRLLLEMNQRKKRMIALTSVLTTIKNPISWILYIMAVTVSLGIINEFADIALIEKVRDLRGIMILIVMGLFNRSFIIEFKTRKLKEIAETNTANNQPENKDGKTTIQIAANIATVFSFMIVGLMILQEFGLSLSGLMAFGGIGGLIVGLSAKEILADFFGGLILIADKPFKVGDWICSPDRDIEGTVEEIGMRRICVRTFDKRPLYIPNSVLSTITIENPSRMTNRRIYETIGIRYEDADKISSITRKVKDMLVMHGAIDDSMTLMVNFNAFGSSSLDFFIYCFTKTTDWQTYHGVKHNVLLNIYEIIQEEGADVAFPTQVIKMENQMSQMDIMQQELTQQPKPIEVPKKNLP